MRRLLIFLALALGLVAPVGLTLPAQAAVQQVGEWGGGGMIDYQNGGYDSSAPEPTVMRKVLIQFNFSPAYLGEHTVLPIVAIPGYWLTDRDLGEHSRMELLASWGYLGPELPYAVPPPD